MTTTPHLNLHMFAELIGRENIEKNVVLATTRWDMLSHLDYGSIREENLKKKHWNNMIHHGAVVERFLNTSDSAWSIVDNIVNKNDQKAALLFQEEMVVQKKFFTQTNAGEVLYLDLGRGNYNGRGTHGTKEPP